MHGVYGKEICLLIPEHVLEGQGSLRDFSKNKRAGGCHFLPPTSQPRRMDTCGKEYGASSHHVTCWQCAPPPHSPPNTALQPDVSSRLSPTADLHKPCWRHMSCPCILLQYTSDRNPPNAVLPAWKGVCSHGRDQHGSEVPPTQGRLANKHTRQSNCRSSRGRGAGMQHRESAQHFGATVSLAIALSDSNSSPAHLRLTH